MRFFDKKKRVVLFVFVLVLFAGGFKYSESVTRHEAKAEAAETVEIVIFHTNDVHGRVVDNRTYAIGIAGANFVMTGNEHYDMLGELPVERELGTANEALIEFVRKHSPVTVPKEGRITTTQAEEMREAA